MHDYGKHRSAILNCSICCRSMNGSSVEVRKDLLCLLFRISVSYKHAWKRSPLNMPMNYPSSYLFTSVTGPLK